MLQRTQIRIEGIVQGVGFRPFVYREALACGVSGWVLNDSRGVLLEAEASPRQLATFLVRLQQRLPPLASITALSQRALPPEGGQGFQIRPSQHQAASEAQIAPDTCVCPECRQELFDPSNPRYRYPFINCTNCGPRYSIVTGIPYDRPKTTMATFTMCPSCQAEYDDPASRRFHAQPNACPQCGPRLQLFKADGGLAATSSPLEAAIGLLQQGRILAIKGLGGYHLAVDACNHQAVAELRRRKARDEKPFALMSGSLAQVRRYARVSASEEHLLTGTERPIVLLEQRLESHLSPLVAPRNGYFGVMLPYTPLHYLLLQDDFLALVMTSGNLSDEPIVFRDEEARARLAAIADAFLSHNREIHTRSDDSIIRTIADKPVLLRRSRGYVPRSIPLPVMQGNVLAVGGELKNTFCLTRRDRAFLSQHIGDLNHPEVSSAFEQSIQLMQHILEWQPQVIAHDLHPDYQSTRYAETRRDLPAVAVQHHHAHLASGMAEHGLTEPCLGMIFDGIGYGADGHIWGGEFLLGDYRGYQRLGHFAYVPMPGGDAASRQPYRMALSYLYQAYGEDLPELPVLTNIPAGERKLLLQMIDQSINSPLTSSCGRLFDAVAALVGLRSHVSYEGQAALELEMTIAEGAAFTPYPYQLRRIAGQLIFDPQQCLRAVVEDLQKGTPVARISGAFHITLASMLLEVCRELGEQSGVSRVVLSGGVFQNRFLTEHATSLLQGAGLEVFTHSLVPPNDGGLSLGQAVIAGQWLKTSAGI